MKKPMAKIPKAKAPKAQEPMAAPIEGLEEDDEEKEPQQYEIEDATNTLEKAEKIKKDKRLMPHVHKHIAGKLSSLKDLRKLAEQKFRAVGDGEDE